MASTKSEQHSSNRLEEDCDDKFDPRQSLFDDSCVCSTVSENINVMTERYGFCIPHRDCVMNEAGLIRHLLEQIRSERSCIYCQRVFPTVSECQLHMIEEKHVRPRFEPGLDLEDIICYYDYTIPQRRHRRRRRNRLRRTRRERMMKKLAEAGAADGHPAMEEKAAEGRTSEAHTAEHSIITDANADDDDYEICSTANESWIVADDDESLDFSTFSLEDESEEEEEDDDDDENGNSDFINNGNRKRDISLDVQEDEWVNLAGDGMISKAQQYGKEFVKQDKRDNIVACDFILFNKSRDDDGGEEKSDFGSDNESITSQNFVCKLVLNATTARHR